MKYILILLFFFTTSVSFAQENTSFIEEVAAQLNLSVQDYKYAGAKNLPDNPEHSIVFITKYSVLPYKETDDGFTCDLILLLVDNNSQKIISKLIEKEKYVSDAYYLSDIELDMANYRVSDEFRAFGIRSSFASSSQVNISNAESISLFIIKNNKIERVLDLFEISSHNGEWNMGCNYEGKDIDSILIMQPNETNGFFDIQVKTAKTIRKTIDPTLKDGDCINMDKKLKPSLQTLQYTKGAYALKKNTVTK